MPLRAGKHLDEIVEVTGYREGAWNLTLRMGHSVESKTRQHLDSMVASAPACVSGS